MTDLRTQLAAHVHELVDPIEHAETHVLDPDGTEGPMRVLRLRAPYPGGGPTKEIRVHRTRHPSLLDQLALAVEPSTTVGVARGYESSPSARLHAIDTLREIATDAARWLIDLGIPVRPAPADNLRALVGAPMDDDELDAVVRDAQRWVTWARVVTGWDVPARRLREPCPACGLRGGIRVRVDPVSAACECGATWRAEDGGIDVLARHIRWVNGEHDTGELERIAG